MLPGVTTGYLNGLRFLSALWVLLAHCLFWGGYQGFIPSPKIAVAVFMVLSGYLMALTASDFSQAADLRQFYTRRFFRIAPLYYFILLFVAFSPWVREGIIAWQRVEPGSFYDPARADFSPANIALHMSFLFGLSRDASQSTLLGDWSLSVEMQFYAAFPLIWLAIRRWGALRVCAALAISCLPLWALVRTSWPDPALLPLQLPCFLAGILACEAKKELPLALLAILLAAFEKSLTGLWSMVPVLVVVGMVALDRHPLTFLRQLLDNRTMAVGGSLSYGLYLTHGLFIAAGGLLDLPLGYLVPFVLVGSLALSAVLFAAIEQPGIALGRRLSRRVADSRVSLLSRPDDRRYWTPK